ncbi:hypothetical protein K491DRAFT_712543 [Lophiostoma macrostomum CBS 122681]|uniref:Uncharacterized protein n=1 Tax=Lophiostoma macrostomum CBS 122681 TaxID=1314788 RepID=A0A6A6THX0_9PLEO|nr:hypothetical protein K491DRAFT_712543 [Lophiostoma macrostomum CBS 122681]
MDYQTFNNQHPSFGGQFSTLPGTPAQATHPSPQQQQYTTDPHGRFMQSTPSPYPYAQQYTNGQQPGFPSMGGAVAANGGLMQPSHNLHRAAFQQQQQQQQHQQHHQQQQQHQLSPSPYSTAPFAQPIASPAHPQFVQNRQTASPASATNHGSPYAHPPTAQQSPSLVPSSTQQLPMSQPPAQSPVVQSTKVETPVKAQQPPSPASPVALAREQERMTTLFEINTLLLKEVVDLQSQGKGGQPGAPPGGQDAKADNKPTSSKEYIDCMRRLQSNLAYLAQNAEKVQNPDKFKSNQALLPGPAIMTVPSSLPSELVELYQKLQSLFPNWKGQAPMKASPGPQRLNSNSSQTNIGSMQPPNSAGLQNNMQPPNSAGLSSNMPMQQTSNFQQQQ